VGRKLEMIIEREGDILDSRDDVILHQVNCKGVMGAGLAKKIADAWPAVLEDYTGRFRNGPRSDLLGLSFFTQISKTPCQWVVSLFGQDGYGTDKRHTDYSALRRAIQSFVARSYLGFSTISVPYKLGCGLGGGDWDIVKSIIEEELADYKVTVWRLPE
jgi:O-acetyl-ADP-ribose deacetylase (regulator of RNase III)